MSFKHDEARRIILRIFKPAIHTAIAIFVAGHASNAQDAEYRFASGQQIPELGHFRECDACPEMIAMPMGSFLFGAEPGESRNRFYFMFSPNWRELELPRPPDELKIVPAEHPRHPVDIDIPFAMGCNEVTHAEWMACVEAMACKHVPDHRVFTKLSSGRLGYVELTADHPVIDISYLDILE